jgi:hypothetical protein
MLAPDGDSRTERAVAGRRGGIVLDVAAVGLSIGATVRGKTIRPVLTMVKNPRSTADVRRFV